MHGRCCLGESCPGWGSHPPNRGYGGRSELLHPAEPSSLSQPPLGCSSPWGPPYPCRGSPTPAPWGCSFVAPGPAWWVPIHSMGGWQGRCPHVCPPVSPSSAALPPAPDLFQADPPAAAGRSPDSTASRWPPRPVLSPAHPQHRSSLRSPASHPTPVPPSPLKPV